MYVAVGFYLPRISVSDLQVHSCVQMLSATEFSHSFLDPLVSFVILFVSVPHWLLLRVPPEGSGVEVPVELLVELFEEALDILGRHIICTSELFSQVWVDDEFDVLKVRMIFQNQVGCFHSSAHRRDKD